MFVDVLRDSDFADALVIRHVAGRRRSAMATMAADRRVVNDHGRLRAVAPAVAVLVVMVLVCVHENKLYTRTTTGGRNENTPKNREYSLRSCAGARAFVELRVALEEQARQLLPGARIETRDLTSPPVDRLRFRILPRIARRAIRRRAMPSTRTSPRRGTPSRAPADPVEPHHSHLFAEFLAGQAQDADCSTSTATMSREGNRTNCSSAGGCTGNSFDIISN